MNTRTREHAISTTRENATCEQPEDLQWLITDLVGRMDRFVRTYVKTSQDEIEAMRQVVAATTTFSQATQGLNQALALVHPFDYDSDGPEV